MTQNDAPDDATLRRILQEIRVVGLVGISANPVRASYFVARYLGLKGKRVIGVNPGLAGQALLGENVVPEVSALPPEVDMLDVFRRSEHVAPIVREALDHLPGLKTVWLQLGVISDEARTICAERGVNFIQNRCPKIEYQRLFGELRMGGFNTGVISAKL